MIFTSPYPDVEIPSIALTEFVLEHSAEYGDKPALIDGADGPDLHPRADRRRHRDGRRRPRAPRHRPGRRRRPLRAQLARVRDRLPRRRRPRRRVHDDQPDLHASTSSPSSSSTPGRGRCSPARMRSTARARRRAAPGVDEVGVIDELLDGDPGDGARDTPAGPDDLVALPYSSGTTGLPKGVMLTHRNLVANILQSTAQQPVTADDTLVGVLPLFHIYGLTVVMNAVLRNGATLVTVPRFDLEGYLGLVAGAPRDEGLPRPADRPRTGQEPGRRALRPLEPDARQLRRRAAERRGAAGRRGAHRLPRRAGLRHDRVEPGHPRHAARPRPPPARLDRAAGAQHRVPDRRRRLRRRARRRRGGRGVRARPAGHARLPRRPRRRPPPPSTTTAGCTRATSAAPTRTATSCSSTASRSSSSTRATRWRRPSSRRCWSSTRPSPRPRSSDGPTRRPARCPRPSWRSPARPPRRRSWPSSPSAWRPTSGCARCEVVDEIPKSPSGKILRRVLNERES